MTNVNVLKLTLHDSNYVDCMWMSTVNVNFCDMYWSVCDFFILICDQCHCMSISSHYVWICGLNWSIWDLFFLYVILLYLNEMLCIYVSYLWLNMTWYLHIVCLNSYECSWFLLINFDMLLYVDDSFTHLPTVPRSHVTYPSDDTCKYNELIELVSSWLNHAEVVVTMT